MLPSGQEAGVLTISEECLSAANLHASGARGTTAIAGLPKTGVFAEAIFKDKDHMDIAACKRETCEAAERLVSTHPNVGAIVLECTNLGPYAANIKDATGRPVYSIVSFLNWFQSGLKPPRFQVDKLND